VLQPKGWPVPKGYSNGMMGEGRILVTGGIVGWDETGTFPDGFVAQARQTLENIRVILAAGGAEPHHIVRLTWYVIDIDEYLADQRELGRAYRAVLGTHYPAMALVQVSRLVEKQALLEIEATAIVPTAK
jgi:enamine deaminase RidA (YjgF/YER057c/UK114 family)